MDFFIKLQDNQALQFDQLLRLKQELFTSEVLSLPLEKIVPFLADIKIFVIFLSVYSKKIFTLLKIFEIDFGENHYDDFLIQTKLYIKKIPLTEVPSCEQTHSLITILYLLTEEAIFQNNLELIHNLSKIYLFEHTHLRLAKAYDLQDILEVLVKGYDQTYDLLDF